jgi:antitoxin VapB
MKVGEVLSKGSGRGGRAEEVATKIARVRSLLDAKSYSSALLMSQANVSWITAGLQDPVVRGEDPGLVWVVVTQDACCLISQNVESPRLIAEEGLGELEQVGLRTYDWWRPEDGLEIIRSLADPAHLINDGWGPGGSHAEWIQALRFELTTGEEQRLIALGADCSEVLEGALYEWRPGPSEREVSGAIAAGLEGRGVFPSVLMVGADERRRRFRHPISSGATSHRDLLAVLVGVRQGLNVALSRTVAAGEPPADLVRDHEIACSVEAALVHASRPGCSWQSALLEGLRAYEAAGVPEEWQHQYQGGPIGYRSREFDVVPGSAESGLLIGQNQAFAWNPTVVGAKSEDTFIARDEGALSVTNSMTWPLLTVSQPWGALQRPGILTV